MSKKKDEFICQYKEQLNSIDDIPDEIKNEYRIEACLNDTPGRQTFLIYSETKGEQYVLKRVLLEYGSELENEYTILNGMKNPAFPSVYSLLKTDKYVYLIREYIKGFNLYQVVESEGVFTEQKSIEIAIAVCRDLDYLHHQTPPVIHRDIKPQNIIYTPENRAVLIDMGAARRYKKDALCDTAFMGTQATAAPEQYGFGQTDARCDIYAMGMLLIFMLTGGFSTDENTLKLISSPLRRVILKCIKFDPKKRYASVSLLRIHLKRCTINKRKTNRACLLAAAGVLLFFAGALAGWIAGTTASHKESYPVNAAGIVRGNESSNAPEITTGKTAEVTITAADVSVQTSDIDDEIKSAVKYGIVPDDIQGDWDKTITYKQYCTMIGKMLALKGSSYADQWNTVASLALDSDQEMKRQEGMLALFFSAKILGITETGHGNWGLLNDKIGKDAWNDMTWNYPLFPDWIDKASYSGSFWDNHMIAAYFFAMDSIIKDSDKRIFDYDKTQNSMLPKSPLNRRDAIHSVLRVYESTF